MGKKHSRIWSYVGEASFACGFAVFATLTLGIILSRLSAFHNLSFLADYGGLLSHTSPVIGCAIGAAIAAVLNARYTVTICTAAVGALGYTLGGPLGAYLACLLGVEVGGLVSGRNSLEYILAPLAVITVGGIAAWIIGPPMNIVTDFIGGIINSAANMHPILFGIIIAVLMGLLSCTPLSAVFIALALGLSGRAAGAATVGCCVFTIGFAVTGFDDNGLPGLISLGLGSSVFMWKNILRHPGIMLPELIVSAILGPVATTLLIIVNAPWGAGVGTGGLMGILGAYYSGLAMGEPQQLVMIKVAIMLVIAPLLLTFLIGLLMKKSGYLRGGTMTIYTTKK